MLPENLSKMLEQYGYLIGANPLWLMNAPGVDNRRVKLARARQLAGVSWRLTDLLIQPDSDSLPMAA